MVRRQLFSFGIWLVVIVLLSSLPVGSGAPLQQAQPSRESRVLALTDGGEILLVVNPDSNSVSLVSLDARDVVAEISVGVQPKAIALHPHEALAYVTNHESDTVSVVDLETRSLAATFAVSDRPVGIAVRGQGDFLAVAEYGADTVRVLDLETLETVSSVPVTDRPYAVAFTPQGETLLVTHLLSGTITLIQMNDYTTSTVATWANVAPAPGITISADGSRAYLPQTMAHGLGQNTQFDNTVFAKVSVVDLVENRHATAEHVSLPEKDQPVGLPWDACLAKDDTELWVVNAASNDVSILSIKDPARPRRVAHVSVADNPRGIVIDDSRGLAYVSNALAGSVTIIDTALYEVIDEILVTKIPLPPVLLTGKRLFHTSARSDVSKAAWISCNTCHVEGEQDGRTWLLQFPGDVPAGADPVLRRNTTSLLGMIETYPLRWSGEWDESADSEFSIRLEQFGTGLIEGEMHATLGTPNQGRAYELDCLAAFIDGLRLPERAHVLTPTEERGRALFESERTGCAVCHPAPLYTDLKQQDVGTANGPGEWFGPEIDTPTLRFLYDSAPYFHDGSMATLEDALTFPSPEGEHDMSGILSDAELQELVAFLLALPYHTR
ncbi:MAG: beta-propeller fold lactonase family protein [Candidatus Bipolaricaulia bacterium]